MNKIQKKKSNFQIESTLIEFNDLDAEITEQLKILYQDFFNQGKIHLTTNFFNKQVNPKKAARH